MTLQPHNRQRFATTISVQTDGLACRMGPGSRLENFLPVDSAEIMKSLLLRHSDLYRRFESFPLRQTSGLQRIPAVFPSKYVKHGRICENSRTSLTGENGILVASTHAALVFSLNGL